MSNIKLFESKKVRSQWDKEEQKWYFSVSDVVGVLTDSADPKAYWRQLKKREPELVTFCHGLKIEAVDGKMRQEDCANVEGLFRIIQSVPSPKAEPFKRWLAKVGYERLEEIENPELASARVREIYKAKGYSEDWISKRVRGIAVRDELTDEWKNRGVKEGKEYAILTAEISKATFGLTPSEYKKHKDLAKPGDNLRDHMTDLELIFTMLGEASTTEIARTQDAQGFHENKSAAIEGGNVAGNAREELEKKSGRRVVSRENYKALSEDTRIKLKSE
ncbi:MAG: Bro-N domain-containing protein [bacterium]|nr:Bro-N domain-containing protein [bacterium]